MMKTGLFVLYYAQFEINYNHNNDGNKNILMTISAQTNRWSSNACIDMDTKVFNHGVIFRKTDIPTYHVILN